MDDPTRSSNTSVAGASLTVLPTGTDGAPPVCLERCLEGDATQLASKGCLWVRAALQGYPDPGLLNAGQCAQKVPVAAEVVRMHDQQVVLISMQAEAQPVEPEHMQLLRSENEALADEVLRNYEQLSLIFDLTQQLSDITEVEQLESLLLARIGKLLHVDRIRILVSGRESEVFDVSSRQRRSESRLRPIEESAWLQTARQSGGVQVRRERDRQLMVGLLQRLDERCDLVLIERSDTAGEFSAGDAQILEALLTFGGQILANNELHQRMRQMSIEATRALVSAIDKKDHYTFGHSERVGFLARLTGSELGLNDGELELLEWAGLLHDVGKIGVPEEILSKPGKLTDEEFEIVKKHPEMGYEILKPISHFEPILEGVLHHHENPDGSGYPHGLAGDAIPLFAGVLHVVDVFDALTSRRSYRDAFSTEKALNIIRSEAGTKLNADLVDAFLRGLQRFQDEQYDLFIEMFPSGKPAEEPS